MPLNSLGTKGEQLAADYLGQKGYSILHRNWRSGKKEIDLIASYAGILIFVEVKARHSYDFGYPEEAVTRNKQAHLRAAAAAFLEMYPAHTARFDVISILIQQGNAQEIIHYEDAFY